MFTFGKKKREENDLIRKVIDQQGEILKVVSDQRKVIEYLQKKLEEKEQEATEE